MRTVIGVDAGGSNTRAVLLTDSGDALGVGRAPGGNPISSGRQQAIESVVGAALAACRAGGAPELVMLTMAGGSTIGGSLDGLRDGLLAAGLPGTYVVEGDTLSTYFSGTTEPTGGAFIAGTGAVGVAVRDGVVTSVVDGAGWLVGDDGAGFWVGRRVVHDVICALDGRGPATSLTGRLLAAIPDTSVDVRVAGDRDRVRVVEHAYALKPVELARFAPLAFEEAGRDGVAATILADAERHLGHAVDSLIARVPDGPIVLGGGVGGTVLGDALVARIGPRARRAKDGLVGSAVLALRHLGVDVSEDARLRVASSLQQLITA